MSLPVNPSLSGVKQPPSFACACTTKPTVSLTVYYADSGKTAQVQPNGTFSVNFGDTVYIEASITTDLSSGFGCGSIGGDTGFTPYTYIYIPNLSIGIQDTSTSIPSSALVAQQYPSSYPPGFSYVFGGYKTCILGICSFTTTSVVATAQFVLDTKYLSLTPGTLYNIQVGMCGYQPTTFYMLMQSAPTPTPTPTPASSPASSPVNTVIAPTSTSISTPASTSVPPPPTAVPQSKLLILAVTGGAIIGAALIYFVARPRWRKPAAQRQ